MYYPEGPLSIHQKRHTVDQIVVKLLKANAELGKGKKVPEICKSPEVTKQTYYRWRLNYNRHRIHSSLDYQTSTAYAAGCVLPASATPQPPEPSRVTNPNSLTQSGAKTGTSHHS